MGGGHTHMPLDFNGLADQGSPVSVLGCRVGVVGVAGSTGAGSGGGTVNSSGPGVAPGNT